MKGEYGYALRFWLGNFKNPLVSLFVLVFAGAVALLGGSLLHAQLGWDFQRTAEGIGAAILALLTLGVCLVARIDVSTHPGEFAELARRESR